MTYHVGDGIRLSCEFTDKDDVATDPTTVTLLIESPSGVVTELTHADDELTKDSEGNYYYDLLIDEAGVWQWRWIGTGVIQQADQGRFPVARENVTA